MKPAIVLCCMLGVLAAFPCSTQAQWRGYGRGGVVQGPDGPLYDTRSPEWRMSGGNIFVYQQIMEQKMLLRQQQMMMMKQIQRNARKRARSSPSVNAGNAKGVAGNGQQAATPPAGRGKKLRAATAQAQAVKDGRAPSSPATRPKTHSEIDPGPSDRPPPG